MLHGHGAALDLELRRANFLDQLERLSERVIPLGVVIAPRPLELDDRD